MRPPAAIQQLCLDTLRDVRATAILDHYRRLKQQMTGSFDSFDSASTSSLDDDDTPCPLECVREVKTGEHYRLAVCACQASSLVRPLHRSAFVWPSCFQAVQGGASQVSIQGIKAAGSLSHPQKMWLSRPPLAFHCSSGV